MGYYDDEPNDEPTSPIYSMVDKDDFEPMTLGDLIDLQYDLKMDR